MGIARARVVEVHSTTSASRCVGAGYVIADRLVLTAGRVVGRTGSTEVRQAGTATWIPTSTVWTSGDAAVLEIDDPSALMLPADGMRWGHITGSRPVAVTAMGFAPAEAPPAWPREAIQLLAHVVPGIAGEPPTVRTATPAGDGMTGAALFAGAELVGVLLADGQRVGAVVASAMAGDGAFVELFGGLELTPVSTPASGFPILAI